MRLIRSLHALPGDGRSGAVAIGNFDGVHKGHARIVETLVARARELEGPSVAFTFDPHPVRLLRPGAEPPPLTWTDRKADLLAELGVDVVVAYPTDETLLSLTPTEFFQRVILQELRARAMVEGPNFHFGRGRTGDIELLASLCQGAGVTLDVVPSLQWEGEYISSSRVRQLIGQGDVAGARQLLTRPYRIRGMVTHGAGRGAKIGFPTANIDAIDTLLPAKGVYAGRAIVSKQSWPAALSIGPNPTFGERTLKAEVHLIGFAGSLYGNLLEVDFLARLRDIQPFDCVASLKKQVAQDVEAARAAV